MSIDKGKGWIGVDLDRTLATYEKWKGSEHIGEPVPNIMLAIRLAHYAGYEIRIFTARVSSSHPHDADEARRYIQQWCNLHGIVLTLGYVPRVTAEKDASCVEIWDDLAVGIERNTGRFLSPSRVLRCTPIEPAQSDFVFRVDNTNFGCPLSEDSCKAADCKQHGWRSEGL